MKNSISLLVIVIFMVTITTLRAQKSGKSWQMVGENDSLVVIPLNINSPRDDYSPIFIDGVLYFSSDRKDRHTDESELQFNESIYSSHYQDSLWSSPKKFYFFNNDDYTSLAGYSAEDSQLFTYKTFGNGDLYSSAYGKKNFSKPKKLKSPINSDGHEQSIAQSNGIVVVSSERPGGRGKHDLYWAVNDSGQYTNFMPIDIVNTPGDEVDVSLSLNGKMLYFSSNSLGGQEGYDIFFTVLDDGKWSTPQSMPINSVNDDRWFMDLDSMFFLSSNRPGGVGGNDIYHGYVIPLLVTYDTASFDTASLAEILITDTATTIPSSNQSYINERPEVGVFSDNIADGKLRRLHSILEVIDFPIYRAYVQIGAYYYLKSIDEYKNKYPAFDTTNIVIEKVETNRGTLYKYIIDKEYKTLKESAVRQQEAILQQKDKINGYNIQKDAFIAVYNKDNERILIYFNVEKGSYKILVGNQLIDF
ncbi:hypothetical protein KKG31_07440 [Patescibacteria group bacterium]|nr:hypothetical protein [Patescibacteria group bacterium]MBU1758908.1 hypothetical protein [Patescibacteria group bacterium]